MLHDERCPFFWWARDASRGVRHSGWPILWERAPGQRGLSRYAGDWRPVAEVFRRPYGINFAPPAIDWPNRLAELEAMQSNAGEGEW